MPKNNIKIKYNDSSVFNGSTALPVALGDADSGDASQLQLEIWPVAGKSGTTKVRIDFKDSGDHETYVEFSVTLNQVDVEHTGWKNLKFLGPRFGGSGWCDPTEPIEDSTVYSNQIQSLTKQIQILTTSTC